MPQMWPWFQNEKPTIESDYIDTGKANFYSVDFTFLGDDSNSAAEASYCTEEQGKYWEYHSASYGVESTSAFFIVSTDSIERIDGPQSSDVFAEVIDSMLSEPM